jgi:hypothetical protein
LTFITSDNLNTTNPITMKFSTIATALTFGAVANAVSVSWDSGYDQAGRSLTAVSCSDGNNGLITKYGWQTQGQIPGFPMIGGAQKIAGWNDAQCGSCWSLTWNGRTVHVLAMDHTATGFNVAKHAMNRLTNGRADELGRVNAKAKRVGLKKCGIQA